MPTRNTYFWTDSKQNSRIALKLLSSDVHALNSSLYP